MLTEPTCLVQPTSPDQKMLDLEIKKYFEEFKKFIKAKSFEEEFEAFLRYDTRNNSQIRDKSEKEIYEAI